VGRRPGHRVAHGNRSTAGLGTVKPDVDGHVNPAFPMNDRYLALEAYKFNVPNTESSLPTSTCSSCVPTTLNATIPGPRARWHVGRGPRRCHRGDSFPIGTDRYEYGPGPERGRQARYAQKGLLSSRGRI